ncbi:hypothetical protein HYH03_010302 [Edaphochlamys debaryana]|uniref:F-box domain-containing protein n=1 Tax=Edaphochlamys debaryana TaxID=47281 RepID=A0A835XW54_9CHLO|nr:hypothetical protein HYH03_010302 [Edaphochlamys debaryana]|eukprot:KAG2491296.1 hypothetical protein HYH03_010302 [Edaphochlamys debaryana]
MPRVVRDAVEWVRAGRLRKQVVAVPAAALLVLLAGAVRRRARRRHGETSDDSSRGQTRRTVRGKAALADQPSGHCPQLWQQIQQRDWLFGLPPQIADAIVARLEVPDLKALRATCRQTYLQVAARTNKLVLALDVSPRTWALAAPRLDSIYPSLQQLHLMLAAEVYGSEGGVPYGHHSTCGAQAQAGPGPGSAALALASRPAGGGDGSRRRGRGFGLPLPFLSGRGGGGGCSCDVSASPFANAAESFRDFVAWSACGQLHSLALLDLSRCGSLLISRDAWVGLVRALGPGPVTLRVPWRSLLGFGCSGGGGSAFWPGGSGSGSGSSSGGGGSRAAARAAAKAAAKAAAAMTAPPAGSGLGLGPGSGLPLLPAPLAPAPRCTCSICGPAPADAAPVVAALSLLADLRPSVSVELVGRGLPVRSPGVLQALGGLGGLAAASLAVCGVRPLGPQAAWLSCLRRLHTLELSYREEGGEAALPQVLRALHPPLPLRRLSLLRSPPAPLDESDLAALAALPDLQELLAPGLRVHAPTATALTSVTRLCLRSDRLELLQPLVAVFPALRSLELGNTVEDLPPLGLLAAAAAAPPFGPMAAAWQPRLFGIPEPGVGPQAQAQPGPGAGFVPADGAGAQGPAGFVAVGVGAPAPAAAAPVIPDPAPGVLPAPAQAQAQAQQQQPQPGVGPAGPAPGPQAAGPLAAAGLAAAGAAAAGPAPQAQAQALHAPGPHGAQAMPPELVLHLRLLQGLAGLTALAIGGRPGHGVEALSSLTALSALTLVRASEFRPLRKAVEELRGLPCLLTLELHACTGGEACGYEIARLLRRLQKLPNLSRLVVQGCDPRLPQQLATAPLARLTELQLLALPELTPLDLRYVVLAQAACRRLVVRGCARLGREVVEAMPRMLPPNRPALAVEWAP